MGGFAKSWGIHGKGYWLHCPRERGVYREERTQPGPGAKEFNRPDPGDRLSGGEITPSRGDPAFGGSGTRGHPTHRR